jgi:hypothetical protein
MKCVIQGSNETCRRCRRAGLPCVFVPRANAAQLPLVSEPLDLEFKQNVLSRLKTLEERLNHVGVDDLDLRVTGIFSSIPEQSPEPTPEGPLWDAITLLQKCSPVVPPPIWQRDTVESLWSSYVSSRFPLSMLVI